jgi:8-oxo-dGTP pyrophosphatase MutT (NUDIX family)
LTNFTIPHIRTYLSAFARKGINDPAFVKAGVLIPLFEQDGELHVLLTQRTFDVEHHKGQISFPGGVVDSSDASIVETALREAEEEIGLPRSTVEVLGVLTDFSTPSGFCISPVVGYVQTLPQCTINPSEVSEIFTVPLAFFRNPANERIEMRQRDGKDFTVYFFRYGKFEIWGATAAIIRLFVYGVNPV